MIKFLSSDEEKRVIDCIKEAEVATTGEIRIHLQGKVHKTAWEDALEVFDHLKMANTQERNGVLIFIVPKDHQLVIIGDKGIHDQVMNGFWVNVRDEMLKHFRDKDFAEGLCAGVRLIGAKLHKYFPALDGGEENPNELPDDISYDM
ncbi:TPM domain-containing protein [Haliscomenobacter sp.]|uniref:TPM domain-containing protein n=1 Tax=Haliscomenobacter sp. TaxID=2717303 RepID=UPI003593C754